MVVTIKLDWNAPLDRRDYFTNSLLNVTLIDQECPILLCLGSGLNGFVMTTLGART